MPELGPEARVWLSARPAPFADEVEQLNAALKDMAEGAHVGDSSLLALATLHALRDPDSDAGTMAALALGLVAGLSIPAAGLVEHTVPPPGPVSRPLLDHVTRAIENFHALEHAREHALSSVLSRDRVARSIACVQSLSAEQQRLVRVALLHLDISKGNSPTVRAAWSAAGINLDIHNLGSEDLLADGQQLARFAVDDSAVRALVAGHGLAGQFVRGETPASALAGLPVELAALLHVIDLCDTAAVREDLLDDRIFDGLVHVDMGRRAGASARVPTLVERLTNLRRGRLDAGEDPDAVAAALAQLTDGERELFSRSLASCQLWYAEAATASLSPLGQLKILAAACGAATRAGVTPGQLWHAQLAPLVPRLRGGDARTRYRVRAAEASLARSTIDELLLGVPLPGPLGAIAVTLGHDRAVRIDWQPSDEADALVTLLAIYETKSSAAFHSTLKALCDLYGLRKDEFDRVANEADYLATMNAARADKERMLDWVRPGRIVEIGPGGGVVLDLLESRFSDSDIIGVDISAEVIAALDGRRTREGHRWTVRHADAFELPTLCAPGSVATVVFCSILHEIYSYVERPGFGRFQLESVADILRAAFATLAPGGRIVIRDGVTPAAGTRRIRLLAEDARSLFELYVAQFEGRHITWRELADGRLELPTPDAMEFLYTYTWGPQSFPYEVREQYGVLEYDAYASAIVDWCGGAEVATLIEIPDQLRSYLQPGYQAGLAGKVELTDEHDRPVALPDSNCLIVVEKRA